MRLTLSLDLSRSLFAAVWAGLVAVPPALLWIAGGQSSNRPSTSLAAHIIGAGSFALLMALFAGIAVWAAVRSIGATGMRYGVALLLADALFAAGVAVVSPLAIATGAYLDEPDASSFPAFAVLIPFILICAFVVAFAIAIPASLVGAGLFELLRRLCRHVSWRR